MPKINWPALISAIQQTTPKLHALSHLTSVTPLSGGDTHGGYRLHTPERDFFLKVTPVQDLAILSAEAHNLKALQESQTVTCPTVFSVGSTSLQEGQTSTSVSWLLLDFLPLQPHGDAMQAGQDLAHLHHTHAERFGWFEDNFIGKTPQLNAWHNDWATFYREHRLKPQIQWAKQNGLPQSTLDLANQLLPTLERFFQDYQPIASLLHGDLWSGNLSYLPDGTPVFYDPASYYGDRETDLAMTELFGGFPDEFYQGYHHVFPLDVDYPQRKPLYQLYHVLNHFNLFGGSYGRQTHRLLQQLLSQ
jgi:protein-ribulosamine 3-kinase